MLDDSRTQKFLSWARGQGSLKWSRLAVASFGGVRGIAATGELKADDLLVEVPRRSAVVLAPKQRNACPDLVTDDWWKSAPWFAKMGAMLIWHKRQGDKSPLASWVAQLPADTGSPVLWDERQLQQLQYPYLIKQVGAMRGKGASP